MSARLLVVAALVSGALPRVAIPLEISRGRSFTFDMEPYAGFQPLASPELMGGTGVLHRFEVSAGQGTPAIRIRLDSTAGRPVPWTARITSRDGKEELDLLEGVGAESELWSGTLPASEVVVEIRSQAPVASHLEVRITAMAARAQPAVGGIVGPSDLESISEVPQDIRGWGAPVAWIGIMVGSRQAVCTGFLVSDDLLVTNHHCIRDERERRSAIFVFGYDRRSSTGREVRALRLEAADEALDYAMVRLAEPAGRHFGRLRLLDVPPARDRPLIVFQHAGGGPKLVARRSCAAVESPVDGNGGPGTEFTHRCDTLGGSSGAPIVDPSRGAVVGLHHFGCTDERCDLGAVNQGVLVKPLVASALAQNPSLQVELESRPPDGSHLNAPGRPVPGDRMLRDPREEAGEPLRMTGGFRSRFSIQEENDVFGLTRPSDRFYTQGARVAARWMPDHDRRFFDEHGANELWGIEIGQNIYTSSDIAVDDLERLRADRPYGGYLYTGVTYELRRYHSLVPRVLRVSTSAEEPEFSSNIYFEVRLGRAGPRALGGPIQTNFHRLLRSISGKKTPIDPVGWGIYEIDDTVTGDATVEYSADWVRLSRPVRLLDFTRWSGSAVFLKAFPRARVDLGGIIDAAGLGLELQLGAAGDEVRARRLFRRPRFPLEAYLWGRTGGRFVAYNRFIQGDLLGGATSDVTLRHWVGELALGATLRVAMVEVAFAQLWRTAEFAPDRGKGFHNFGAVQVSFLY